MKIAINGLICLFLSMNGGKAGGQSAFSSLESNMVLIKGGSFNMGGNRLANGKPMRPVQVNSFKLCRFDVTQALWKAVMIIDPSDFRDCDDCPVAEVSWFEAQEFIHRLDSISGLHYRLPSEAEWEYAARGGNLSHGYAYSGSDDLNSVAWYDDNCGSAIHPVGEKQPNELGLYDMTGNVWQWCANWLDTTQQYRVLRGCSWYNNAGDCRIDYRSGSLPDSRSSGSGLRLAEDL